MAFKVAFVLMGTPITAMADLLPGERDWSAYTYEQYGNDFKKIGANSVNDQRKAIFDSNLKLVLQHNMKSDKTWHAGPNEFTDWTNQEFRARRTGSRPDVRAIHLGVEHVTTEGPIPDSLDWRTKTTSSGGQLYFGGIMSGSNNYDMDHAVQLVGYGTENGKDYWLVRNSWGGWGEKGYIRLQRFGEGKEPCGTDNTPQDGDACAGDTKPRTYCGECGVLSSSGYPTGLKKATSEVQV